MNSYYKYWDGFVKLLVNATRKQNGQLSTFPQGWKNPDDLPLYNNPKNKDLSSLYIPEPWWGNDGNHPLHSVVINYNPGKADKCQECAAMKGIKSYAKDVVNGNVLKETRNWHYTHRAKPVISSLIEKGFIRESDVNMNCVLKNHLSIELVPWHTMKVNSNYEVYLKDNIQQVYEHCILFAAHESMRINNECLKNVVILKISGNKTRNLINCLNNCEKITASVCINDIVEMSADQQGKSKYLIFKIKDSKNSFINKITFVSIWGKYTRNNFPTSALPEILEKIYQYKIIKS